MIQIEFFHDVICSFCFPMSYRMRKIADQYNNLEIIHRSFALGWSEKDFIRSFGSREAVKPEVLTHWQAANDNDDLHRFNIEGMRQTDFDFPTSRNALLAAKAAGILWGQEAYWAVFDQLQDYLFVKNQNIEDLEVIQAAMADLPYDSQEWLKQFEDPATEAQVLADLQLGQNYGVYSAPTLVINQKYAISGAQPLPVIDKALQQISQEEGIPLNKLQGLTDLGQGPSCKLEDGQWSCE